MCKSNLQSASSPLYSHLRKHKHTHTNTPNIPRTLSHTQKQLCRYGVSKSIDYFFLFRVWSLWCCGVGVYIFYLLHEINLNLDTNIPTQYAITPSPPIHAQTQIPDSPRKKVQVQGQTPCMFAHTHTYTPQLPTQHRWTPFLNVPPPVQPLFLSHLTFRLLSSCCLLVELLSSFSCGIWASFFFLLLHGQSAKNSVNGTENKWALSSLSSLLSIFCCLSMLYPGPMPDVSTSPDYFHSLYQRTALSWLLREAFYTCRTYFHTWIYPTNVIHSIVDMISFLFLQI